MSSAQTGPPARVVVACDKFKGSLTAAQVGDHIDLGLRRVAPQTDVMIVPVADGGDGTLEAALAAGFTEVPVRCSGPTGEPVDSAYAVRGEEAVVELADACGLLRLPGGMLRPMTASSRGLGEVLAVTLTHPGVRRVIIGAGGSASTDGGTGMLAGLGVRLLDAHGNTLGDGGRALADLAAIDVSGMSSRLAEVELVLATDVTNPLLGESGAAAVFAPQKGASPAEVAELESALTHYSGLITAATGRDDTERPGAGAAGGVGYAALALLSATMRPGVDVVLELSGFEGLVNRADLVITGEGSLDPQTLLGKAPIGVARAAAEAGVPVVAVCGRSQLSTEQLAGTGISRVYALTDLEPDTAVSIRKAGPLLEQLAERIVADWLA